MLKRFIFFKKVQIIIIKTFKQKEGWSKKIFVQKAKKLDLFSLFNRIEPLLYL